MEQQQQHTNIIELTQYKLEFFRYDQKYHDDFDQLFQILMTYDHIIIASPIYWYTVCAQMKVFIDRLSDLLFGSKDRLNLSRTKSFSFIGTYATSFNDALKQIRDTFCYLQVGFTEAKAVKIEK